MNDPSETSDFADLMQRIQAGSQDAAWELLDKYGPHVRRHVRRSLNPQMRSRFDSVDFMQIVWASFFREPERIRRLDSPQQLMGYLAAMARNKVVKEVRHQMSTEKRDLGREVSLDAPHEALDFGLAARDPTPSSVAVARERWTQLVDEQPESTRKVVELRFLGASFVEIARELNIHERTARKIISRLVGAEEPATGNSREDKPLAGDILVGDALVGEREAEINRLIPKL
jgi:RNA polymerase sigma-70 factor (ECF subfamily)